MALSPNEVVRVRTVNRRPEAERWSPHIIETLQLTPQKWDTPGEVTAEGLAIDADDLDTGEPFELDDPEPASSSLAIPRRPRLSQAKRRELGLTLRCKGCERINNGESGVPRAKECWLA